MTEWATIDSAPKDGMDVLVFCEGKILVARWVEIVRGYWVWGMPTSFRDGRPITVLGPEHFVDGTRDHFHLKGPTHWMPLPEPPKSPDDVLRRGAEGREG
jgi:hypothetical protein